VHVRLQRGADAFARKRARYWIVRPEVSPESISGLANLFSGPTIEAEPGSGEMQTEFATLSSKPVALGEGTRFVLLAPRRTSIQAGSPIYYRGVEVGVVEDCQLSADATGVTVPIFIRQRYAPLVRTDSVFWAVGGADVQGGIFTGVRVRVESLRSLLAGGVTFTSPTKGFGPPANEGAEFQLFDEAKKEWPTWSPIIALPPVEADQPSP
jgi:paraquat-inducible protein B